MLIRLWHCTDRSAPIAHPSSLISRCPRSQWKERDDPLDALSRKGGLLGSLGNFLGGKVALSPVRAYTSFATVHVKLPYVSPCEYP